MAKKPPHEPTDDSRDLVKSLVLVGLPQDKIAPILKISETTLKKHYKYELSTGHNEIVGKAVRGIYQKAASGHFGAMCFIAKTKGGFKETVRNEIGLGDLSGATDEELAVLEKFLTNRAVG